MLGTPAYMSPEQIMGLPVDGRSDLFSAGVILYQFLTGERPFSGSATTTMQKVLKEDPLPPSSLNIQVLPVMDAVVRKALAKNADERYQTAQEFADAIGAAASTTSVARGRRARGQHRCDGHRAARPAATAADVCAASAAATRRRRRAPPPPAPRASPASAPRSRRQSGDGRRHRRGGDRRRRRRVVRLSALRPRRRTHRAGAGDGDAPVAHAHGRLLRPRCRRRPHPPPIPARSRSPRSGSSIPAIPATRATRRCSRTTRAPMRRARSSPRRSGFSIDAKSLDKNYDLLKDKLLANSGNYIKAVVRESEPRVGKDGLDGGDDRGRSSTSRRCRNR